MKKETFYYLFYAYVFYQQTLFQIITPMKLYHVNINLIHPKKFKYDTIL